MTIGTDRVRVSFNPSADSVVDQIKQKTADLTDLCETLRMQRVDDPETLKGMDNLQARRPRATKEAAMWAVKAATAQKA